MKKRVWINLFVAFLVFGLLFTVSCAKKTVVADPTIEDQAAADAKAKAEAERIKQQKLEDELAKQRALEEAKKAASGQRFQNQDVHFSYDSSEISSMAKMLLKEKAAYLKENSLISATIEGHCDERGTTDYNLALGERRATAVKGYLANLGVSASRLNTISYGEEKPVDTGKSEESYRKNRRAHFVIE
ncbi:MAG: peptidoglycan-associated lipoprotein Pal [Desulfobacteraceae bacterium]|nr:peptidoglycan-associated lipoprotein Pal [Desulfobacteraceae bacterium]